MSNKLTRISTEITPQFYIIIEFLPLQIALHFIGSLFLLLLALFACHFHNALSLSGSHNYYC